MNRSPCIFAHRGAKSVAPENTLPAFETALEIGVDGIELDVHCAKDGELVVIHDFRVDATTNGQGPVADFTATELANLDAGRQFDPSFAGVGVPTLAQVLDLIGNRCTINIEIKSQDIQTGGNQVEPLLALIAERDLYDQVLVSSFNPVSLIKMRSLDKRVDIGVLHGPDLPLFLRSAWTSDIIAPQALHPHHTCVDAAYMAWAHERNLDVNTWTVNDLDEARRLVELGVSTIMSDVPDQLIAMLFP
jgi:glycerophosphoryl diester phosphodiesterase